MSSAWSLLIGLAMRMSAERPALSLKTDKWPISVCRFWGGSVRYSRTAAPGHAGDYSTIAVSVEIDLSRGCRNIFTPRPAIDETLQRLDAHCGGPFYTGCLALLRYRSSFRSQEPSSHASGNCISYHVGQGMIGYQLAPFGLTRKPLPPSSTLRLGFDRRRQW
jgi:hypothetical protein